MESQLKVSVVIPTYNRKDSLKKVIASLIDSEYKPDEIIIVDDGSTDGTEEMIKGDDRIHYLKQDHQGAAKARNIGGFAASGDLIFFTDSDCVVEKDCINWLVAEMQKNSIIVALGCRIIGITKGYFAKCHDYSHFHSFMLKEKVKRKFVCSSGLVIRKKIFKEVGGFDNNLKVAEDEDLGMRLSEKKYQIFYLPEAIIYHDHGRNNLKKLLSHSYRWAAQGSILPYLKYKDNQYNRFASKNPWFYLLLSPLISLIVSVKIIEKIFNIDKKALLYFPGIILDKMVWCLGTFKFLKNEN